jgi:hypothetical protein
MFGAFVSRIKCKSLIIFLFLRDIVSIFTSMSLMYENRSWHTYMHLVFFEKIGETNGIRADPHDCAYGSVCRHRAHGVCGPEMGTQHSIWVGTERTVVR